MLTISCNQPQTKTADEKVEDIKTMASKFGWNPQEIHIHKTTESDCKLRLNPNSLDDLMTITKSSEVEILAEQSVKEGILENTWYKVVYKNKIGWISKDCFIK